MARVRVIVEVELDDSDDLQGDVYSYLRELMDDESLNYRVIGPGHEPISPVVKLSQVQHKASGPPESCEHDTE